MDIGACKEVVGVAKRASGGGEGVKYVFSDDFTI